jgi:GDP-mannose 4,6 dehydratase
VTRKVIDGVARIKLGLTDTLSLGNLDAQRDWGFAGDYVQAMWLMPQQPEPDDYVIATGESHSVQELVEVVFGRAGVDWQNVRMDPSLIRLPEVDHLIGDASKAQRVLGWTPSVDPWAHGDDGGRRPRAAPQPVLTGCSLTPAGCRASFPCRSDLVSRPACICRGALAS